MDDISIEDCVNHGSVNHDMCKLVFGENMDTSHMINWSINREGNNYLVWNPKCSNSSIVNSIYNWLNCDSEGKNGK